jgi:hypothetical protein
MKTIDEIMKVTECTLEQAEKLHNELIKLPEKLGNFMSDHLDIVNAYNADEIEIRRHFDYSRNGGNIIIKRVNKKFPTYLDGTPNYNHWKYCFDCLIDYVGESMY